MTDTPQKRKPRTTPLSIRFSDAEKRKLLDEAGKQPLGIFIRTKLLEKSNVTRRRVWQRPPSADGKLLGQLLALLGQTRLSSNLNQLAKAANLGALPVTTETEQDIKRACAEVFEMRSLLLRALGVHVFEQTSAAADLAEPFNDAAGRRP